MNVTLRHYAFTLMLNGKARLWATSEGATFTEAIQGYIDRELNSAPHGFRGQWALDHLKDGGTFTFVGAEVPRLGVARIVVFELQSVTLDISTPSKYTIKVA